MHPYLHGLGGSGFGLPALFAVITAGALLAARGEVMNGWPDPGAGEPG